MCEQIGTSNRLIKPLLLPQYFTLLPTGLENYIHGTVHRNKFLFNKANWRTNFSKFIFVKKLYMFQAVPLPIIRSSPLYIRRWYMSCNFGHSFQARLS